MSLIEIITDDVSKKRLQETIKKQMIDSNEIIYINEANIENMKNIKFETTIINSKIKDIEKIKKNIDNSRNLIINLDNNVNIKEIVENKKMITYGYNSQSDITISSVKEEQLILYIQRKLISIFNRKIDIQEIKVNMSNSINIYDIMLVIALTILYAK